MNGQNCHTRSYRYPPNLVINMVPSVPHTENAPNTIPADSGFTLLLSMVIIYFI